MTTPPKLKSVLFVCTANICRSPAGEGILKKLIQTQGLTDQIFVDSAGTSSHFEGHDADHTMQFYANKRGYPLTSKSRRFAHEDFSAFDLIIGMDNSNYESLTYFDTRGEFGEKIKRLVDFLPENHTFPSQVPDPYAGGEAGFEQVLDMLEAACPKILETLITPQAAQ